MAQEEEASKASRRKTVEDDAEALDKRMHGVKVHKGPGGLKVHNGPSSSLATATGKNKSDVANPYEAMYEDAAAKAADQHDQDAQVGAGKHGDHRNKNAHTSKIRAEGAGKDADSSESVVEEASGDTSSSQAVVEASAEEGMADAETTCNGANCSKSVVKLIRLCGLNNILNV